MVRTIAEEIRGGMYESPIFSEYFSGMNVIVADIETTGLSPKRSAVILGGAVFADGDGRKAVQYFADSTDDERELLQRYAALLARGDVVVTFNGQRFDLPFLKTRMERHGLPTESVDRLYSLDLYRVVRYHSYLPQILPNLKQKTVEAYLGDSSQRTDEIDGAKSVELYYEYMKSEGARRERLLDAILLHNRDDIVRLSDMMRILRTLNLHEILHDDGFPALAGEFAVHVRSIRFRGADIRVSGVVYGRHTAYKCFGDRYEFELSGDSEEFSMVIFGEYVSGCVVADIVALGADCLSLREMGGYESGYLILREGDRINYREVNALVRQMLCGLLQ